MHIKLLSLSKNQDFKSLLAGKKVSNKYLTIFFKNLSNKSNNYLNIGFVTQKKLGNAVKRNKIKRKLKSIVLKLLKINSAINSNYTYIIFGKSKVYEEQSKELFKKMKNSFKIIRA